MAYLPVRRSGYPSEVLKVAPGFVKPDSAAAARIQSEILKSRQVSRRSQREPGSGPARFGCRGPAGSPALRSRAGIQREVQSRHLGTDFAGAVGAPVPAPARGGGAGGGLLSGGQGGLPRSWRRAGYRLFPPEPGVTSPRATRSAAGQRIGAVGRSGRVTGPHLHWIARYGAISVDPMSLLRAVQEPVTLTQRRGQARYALHFVRVTLPLVTSASPQEPAEPPSDPPCPCSSSSPARRKTPSAWPRRSLIACDLGRDGGEHLVHPARERALVAHLDQPESFRHGRRVCRPAAAPARHRPVSRPGGSPCPSAPDATSAARRSAGDRERARSR